MKVSVIIPLFNKAPFVEEAIQSVLAQDFDDLEIIVVDDVSTDDSYDIVAAMQDLRIKLYKNEKNLGAALCAQRCIDKAKGEYLIRLDADDLCVPDRVSKQVAFMDAHPEVGVSGGFLQLFGEYERVWKYPAYNDECKAQLLFGVPVAQGSSIMRHSVIKEHAIRYTADLPAVGEDWLYWLHWSKVSRFGNIQEPIIMYRRGEHNASVGRDKFKDNLALFQAVFNFFEIPITDKSLEAHLYTLKLFRADPTPDSVRSFREHLDSLSRINLERDIFPSSAFQDRIERSWNELFYYLPPFGRSLVSAYKELSNGLSKEERRYYFRYRVNGLLKRN